MKTLKIITAILLTGFPIGIFIVVGVNAIHLEQNCTGYLKRAADANTVPIALKELQNATTYLESNDMTNGYTSVIYKTPEEDIEFWYQNLKASELELSTVDSTTSSIEQTNLLMKLRETLIDTGTNGDTITVPQGLSRYPHNGMWGVLLFLASLSCVGLTIWGITELGDLYL